MQVSFTASGAPSAAKAEILRQSDAAQKQSTPKAAECTAACGQAIAGYLDALVPNDSVSVSFNLGISHSTPV